MNIYDHENNINRCVSVFKNCYEKQPSQPDVPLTEFIDSLKTGFRSQIEQLRQLPEDQYRKEKQKLPAITPNGTFLRRSQNGVFQSNGIVHHDIDHLPADTVKLVKAGLSRDNKVAFAFTSVSGEGLKVGFFIKPVKTPEEYKHAWKATADYIAKEHLLTVDPLAKDISRLCYWSYDPEPYINMDAEEFTYTVPPSNGQLKRNSEPCSVDATEHRVVQTVIRMLDQSYPGNRHHTRMKAGRLLGGAIAAGWIDEDEAWDSVSDAVQRNTTDPNLAFKEMAQAIEYGKDEPLSAEDTLAGLEAQVAELIKPWELQPTTPPEPQPTPQPKTDRSWKSYSVEEIASWSDPVCQIEGHWEVGANVMLFGASGSGKSFFALDAAFCIATGLPLFGKYAVRKGPVIYLCGEGQAGIRKRIEAWRTFYNVPVEDLKDFRLITQPFDLRDPDKTTELILGIYEDLGGRPPVAVFIDTLSCYMYGSDRNDEDAKNYIFSCNMLTKNLGATVISVHHTGWDAGDRNRGASNFKDSADTQIKVETAGVQRSNISFIKQKNMELGIPYFIVKKLVADSVVWCLEKEVITKRMNLTDKQRAFLDFIIERCGMQKFDDIELRHAAEQEHLGTAKSLREWIKEFAKLQLLICEGEQLYRINTALCPEAVR